MNPYWQRDGTALYHGDCLDVLAGMEPDSVDAVVTDAPYGLEFMGKEWDKLAVPKAGNLGGFADGNKPSFERVRKHLPAQQAWHQRWAEAVLRVLKPGGHLVAFGGTRTHHRLWCALEDAGFEIRDTLSWLYGQGFPKSLDVSKAIDKRGGAEVGWFGPWLREERKRRGVTQKELAQHFPSKTGGLTGCVANWELSLNLPTVGEFNTLCDVLELPFTRLEEAERKVISHNKRPAGWYTSRNGHDITAPATDAARRWDGWGTALKPAWEPIVLARKPLSERNVAANVQAHGTGALNIAGCRIDHGQDVNMAAVQRQRDGTDRGFRLAKSKVGIVIPTYKPAGRWPPNVALECTCEQTREGSHTDPECPCAMLDAQSGERASGGAVRGTEPSETGESGIYGRFARVANQPHYDHGGASRFLKVARWTADELLLCRAKAIMEAWNNGLANTADDGSSLPSEAAVSVLGDAVTLASQGAIGLSDCQGLSTNVTPSVLTWLCENVIALTLSIEPASLPASFPIGTVPSSGNPVKSAELDVPTVITTIIPNPTNSDGSAVVVTLTTTPRNMAVGDADSSARFRYVAKASRRERGKGNSHATVKPLALMRWLVRLVTSPNGLILDPFLGSGTTALAARAEGFRCIGIEQDESYCQIAVSRLETPLDTLLAGMEGEPE